MAPVLTYRRVANKELLAPVRVSKPDALGQRAQFLNRWILSRPSNGDAVIGVAGKHVKVQVRNSLPGSGFVCLEHGNAGGSKCLVHGASDSVSSDKKRGCRRLISVEKRFVRLPAGDDDVTRIDLASIHERENQLVLVHLRARQFACDNFLEHGLRHIGKV